MGSADILAVKQQMWLPARERDDVNDGMSTMRLKGACIVAGAVLLDLMHDIVYRLLFAVFRPNRKVLGEYFTLYKLPI
jgi:hypothetical protein